MDPCPLSAASLSPGSGPGSALCTFSLIRRARAVGRRDTKVKAVAAEGSDAGSGAWSEEIVK